MDPIVKPVVPPAILYKNQRQWVEKNAKPREVPKPPKIDRGPMFSNAGRMEELAMPLHKYIPPKDDPNHPEYISRHLIKDSALSYVATGRISELAEPKPPITPKHKWEHYKCMPMKRLGMPTMSERLNKLATPRKPIKRGKRRTRAAVSKKALKFKASKRLETLAEPIKRTVEFNEFAYVVSPAAMKYFPSKRTREMARPIPSMTEEEFQKREAERQKRKIAYDQKRMEKLEREKEAVAERHVQERRGLGL